MPQNRSMTMTTVGYGFLHAPRPFLIAAGQPVWLAGLVDTLTGEEVLYIDGLMHGIAAGRRHRQLVRARRTNPTVDFLLRKSFTTVERSKCAILSLIRLFDSISIYLVLCIVCCCSPRTVGMYHFRERWRASGTSRYRYLSPVGESFPACGEEH